MNHKEAEQSRGSVKQTLLHNMADSSLQTGILTNTDIKTKVRATYTQL